jgi:hypothetical protein
MAKTYKRLDTPVTVYLSNPSVKQLDIELKTKKCKKFVNGNKSLYILDASTGEQTAAQSGATFIEEKVVDTEQFIKFYTQGIDELMNLTGAGLKVFKLVYMLMIDNHNKDLFILDFKALVARKLWNWSQTTFISGVNELLAKQILFKAIEMSSYFVNVKFFFNGDRINIVKSYKLKQADMFDDIPEYKQPLLQTAKDFITDKLDEASEVRTNRKEKLNVLIKKFVSEGYSEDEAFNEAVNYL